MMIGTSGMYKGRLTCWSPAPVNLRKYQRILLFRCVPVVCWLPWLNISALEEKQRYRHWLHATGFFYVVFSAEKSKILYYRRCLLKKTVQSSDLLRYFVFTSTSAQDPRSSGFLAYLIARRLSIKKDENNKKSGWFFRLFLMYNWQKKCFVA